MKKALQVAVYGLFALVARAAWSIEEPSFDLVATVSGVDYRYYQPYLVAETNVSADMKRNDAANTGFRRLFRYISGDNLGNRKIAMTAPVRQNPTGRKIAMTAPVRQSETEGVWSVAFVLPKEFTLENVPQPTNPQIEIREIPGELVATLRYSGRWTAANVAEHTAELNEHLAAESVEAIGNTTVAYYNSPFSLPFLRRNEIMVAVSAVPASTAATDQAKR